MNIFFNFNFNIYLNHYINCEILKFEYYKFSYYKKFINILKKFIR